MLDNLKKILKEVIYKLEDKKNNLTNNSSFNKYNEEAENTGGDFWSFLDATTDTILNDNLFLY